MDLNFHEDLKRPEKIRGSSDRNFGLVFASVLTVLSLWPLRAGGHIRVPALGLAGVFLAATLLRPALLHPLKTSCGNGILVRSRTGRSQARLQTAKYALQSLHIALVIGIVVVWHYGLARTVMNLSAD